MIRGLTREDKLNVEFLPPALEIEQTPASPLGRALIWIILLLTVITIFWSYFGMVDEVAVTRGKIIPDGRVKVIQPVEEGVIRAIHVGEGQRVREGQLLIELDSTIKQADVETNEKNLLIYHIEKEMLLAELKGEDVEKALSKKDFKDDKIANIVQVQKNLKEARESEYKTKEEAIKLTITQMRNELNSAQILLPLYEESVRLVKEEEKALIELFEKGAVAKMDLINKQKEVSLTRQKFEEQKLATVKVKDGLNQACNNLAMLKKERHKVILDELKEKEKAIAAMEGEVIKSRKRYEQERLISPVKGTVHGLAAYTIGGVVTPAQPVVTIVPDGTPLIAEATALNKDIGFLKVGQEAEIKLDTFPFQKYGTIKGNILSISPDAFEDEKLGPVYRIKAKLENTSINVNGRDISLTPGMSLTVEVKTGKRRIIEFFLSPIIKHAKESLTIR